MEIKKIEYIKTALLEKDLPKDNKIEIGLMGRSNVGKSTFINTLGNNKTLARTSKKPGKTITLNFYLVNNDYYLVDMPGYGYARRENLLTSNFSDKVEEYTTKRKNLKGAILIIDSRVVTKDDIDMMEYIKNHNLEYIILLSKIDKLKRNDIKKRIKETSITLNINENKIVPFSSLSKENLDKVKDSLDIFIN